MTNLDCNVTDCLYQANNCCCKDGIHVKGNEAKNKQETCCGSFSLQHSTGAKNSCGSEKYAAKATDVLCDAVNCVYNEEKHCNANHIGISGVKAVSSAETQCASFMAK